MNPVRSALYAKLTGTAAINSAVSGRIYFGLAPANATYPYIVFSKVSGAKTRAFQTPEAFKREVWLVKAVDRGSSANTAESVAALVDTALDGGTVTVSGKRLADLAHVSDVSYPEPDGDQLYHHSGANYAVVTTAT